MSAKKKLCGNLTCVSKRASGIEKQTWVEGTLIQRLNKIRTCH